LIIWSRDKRFDNSLSILALSKARGLKSSDGIVKSESIPSLSVGSEGWSGFWKLPMGD